MTTPQDRPASGALLKDPRPWAFSLGELTAGLRRRSGDPKLQVQEIESYDIGNLRPSIGRVRGLVVHASGNAGEHVFELVLKEPLGETRTGTAGVGLREVSVYRYLADQLPLRVPQLVAAHPLGEWLVLKLLSEGREPGAWTADDYLLAVDQLNTLHDRFWGLGEDLTIYNWLARPLDSDFEIYVKAAAKGVQTIVEAPDSPLVRRDPDLPQLFGHLVLHADRIAAILREAPATLIHGEYWPGNIHLHLDGSLTVYDWQHAGIGPGVLDLVTFLQDSLWWFDPLPVDPQELVARYRQGLAASGGHVWPDQEWEALWECALLWTFLAHWIDLLAAIPASLVETRYGLFESVWLEPLRAATERHLPPR